ncbi:hypothetical protein ACJJIR_08510 [Microbulbifer sp. SSSA008]|uniref:hypothetical protein n=1 Tax=Microbulbifer sp. SSSA008 TaxID=3243380 RepID=UPI00403A5E1D
MFRILLMAISIFLSVSVAAEDFIVGKLEEVTVEDKSFSKVEHLFLIKDEVSGNYFFLDKKKIKGLSVKHGDRISIDAEYEGSQIVEVRHISLL